MMLTSSTGYGVSKFDNTSMPIENRTQTTKNLTCCPSTGLRSSAATMQRLRLELGTLTDDDLNLSLNKLYARAGLPNATVASLSAINDPANNMNVSSPSFGRFAAAVVPSS